jgi:hypothetical protein
MGKKKAPPRTELWYGQRIKCYVKGLTKFADPYTVVFMDQLDERTGNYFSRGMSARPTHPQGVGMAGECRPGPHLGRKIRFKDLPEECRKVIKRDAMDFTKEKFKNQKHPGPK